MPTLSSLEVITDAPLDVAQAEAVSAIEAHCIVEEVVASPANGKTVLLIRALYGNDVEVAAKAEEVRQAVGRYGPTDVVIRWRREA